MNVTKNPDKRRQNKSLSGFQIALLLAVALFALVPRLDGPSYFPGIYLWAEDGKIFINDAQSMGVRSLFSPYAGYLHAYPRLITLLATVFELINRPAIMLAGWFLAYLFMFFVLIRRASQLGSGFVPLAYSIVLASLQPNYGENFFNITNAQWLLGAGFALLVLTTANAPYRFSATRLFFLLLLGLTGPFSIILLPALAFRQIAFKDIRTNAWVYLTIFLCAAVQAFVLIDSGRTSVGETSAPLRDWLAAFLGVALFGANSFATIAAALLFWSIVFYFMAFDRNNENTEGHALEAFPAMLFLTAAIFIISSQYAYKNNPLSIVAPGSGNRYTWIPYVLVFSASFLASNGRRVAQFILFLLALFICLEQLQRPISTDLQFSSFSNFSRYFDTVIPIHPQWPTFPGWHINAMSTDKKTLDPRNETELDLAEFTVAGAEPVLPQSGLHISSNGNKPALISKNRLMCDKATDVALEIDISRSAEGWIRSSWDANGKFSEVNSLKRWYPAGLAKAQFAFPYTNGGLLVRIDPLEIAGTAEIRRIKAYCLP